MKRLKQILDISVTVLVVAAAGLVIWRQFVPVGQLQARPGVEDASGTIPVELAINVRGTGPLALVEFADFECPACGQHVRSVEPLIRREFIDTGVIRHVFVTYPLVGHAHAEPAAEAALCAGNQHRFWDMHDVLFRDQTALDRQSFIGHATELGLDVVLFSECIDVGGELAAIERNKTIARDLGVQGTPSFFLGFVQPDGSVALQKRINGAMPFGDFQEAITTLGGA